MLEKTLAGVLIGGVLAGACATAAVVADGITYKPFIRGMERRGEVVISKDFIGLQWPDGDETAFAGLSLPSGKPRTGP